MANEVITRAEDNTPIGQDVNLDVKTNVPDINVTTDKTVITDTKVTDDKSTTTAVDDTKAPDFKDFLDTMGEVSELNNGLANKTDDKKTVVTDDKTDDKTGVVAKTTDKTKQPQARDYSELEDDVVPLFKNMSNDAFTKLKPVYLESKKQKVLIEEQTKKIADLQKGAIPENYLSHPRAYILTPEFETAANTSIKAQTLVNHWQEQLNKVRAGEEEYEAVHISPEDDSFYTTKVKADKKSEETIVHVLDKMKEQANGWKLKLQSISQDHGKKHGEAVAQVKSFEDAAFSIFNKDEVKDKLAPIVIDTIQKIIPPQFQSHPLAPLIAKALITINNLGNELKKVKDGKVVTTTDTKQPDKSDKAKLNPTNADMGGGASGKTNGDDVKYEDFGQFLPAGRV